MYCDIGGDLMVTPANDKFIRDNYKKMRVTKMAELLGLKPQTVSNRIHAMNLSGHLDRPEKVDLQPSEKIIATGGILKTENGVTRHKIGW